MQLTEFMDHAKPHHSVTKAIISPHAGYRYAGRTAAYAYKSINTSVIRRVFVIGPCHFQYVDGCALPDPSVSHYDSPLGSFPLDHQVINELRSNSEVSFKNMKASEDEEEHSIEMQIPFLRHIFGSRQDVMLVPIYVGALLQNEERLYGRALSRYFDDPASLFVVSSDFCHFGHRFRFTPREFPSMRSEIYSQDSLNGKIESLDRQGMQFIAALDCEGFFKYLQSTGNTICGKNPILIFLQILRHAQTKVQVEFIHYSQSTDLPPVPSRDDSCVSYAAGIAFV